MSLYPSSTLDPDQIIKLAYDDDQQSFRTNTQINLTAGQAEVSITHVDDSIKVGDGTKLVTITSVSSKNGLDINLINASIPVTQSTSPWIVSGTVSANQSGTWNLNNISGTISLPTGSSTAANQVITNASLSSIDSKLTSPIEIFPSVLTENRYSTFVNIRQETTTAADEVVWSMRNADDSLKNAYIEELYFQMSFDTTTPIARSTSRYAIRRFNTATPTDGSQITPFKIDNLNDDSIVDDIRTSDAGLNTTGIVLGEILGYISCPCVEGSTTHYKLDKLNIVLAPGEGLLISLFNQAVVGQYIGGSITWSEI